ALGTPARLGGTTWERRVIDPLPGPRRLNEVSGAEALAPAVALAGAATSGPGGFRFAEAHMAAFLGEPIVLVDPNAGPAAVAAGPSSAAPSAGSRSSSTPVSPSHRPRASRPQCATPPTSPRPRPPCTRSASGPSSTSSAPPTPTPSADGVGRVRLPFVHGPARV